MKIDAKLIGVILLVLVTAGIGLNMLNAPVKIDTAAESLEVTVYNDNLGVVKEYRTKYLSAGDNEVLYEGVASQIDPTSVKLRSTNGNIVVQEQNFRYDIVSKEKILEKYIDKEITAYQVVGNEKQTVSGTLLSYSSGQILPYSSALTYSSGQVILKDKDGKILIVSVNDLVLPELPEGLITKPTLDWMVTTDKPLNHTLELSYMTGGMSWKADYVAVIDKDDKKLDLNSWVTITNNAGTTFNNAKLVLMAGTVNRVQDDAYYEKAMMDGVSSAAGARSQFTEQAFFEYHQYDLGRKTTLRSNEAKQISLLTANSVGVQKEYVFDDIQSWWWYGNTYSSTGESKLNVMLNFNNTKANNLGIPLPKGTVRVFKEDASGSLQFVGEDSIDHTPKDESIRLKMGQAFDIVGERKQTSFRMLSSSYEYEWEVTIRNHKDEDIVATIVENTGGDWEINTENYQHTKESQNKISWKIPVKANGETKLVYKIRYAKGY
jgi:hypothetical protein